MTLQEIENRLELVEAAYETGQIAGRKLSHEEMDRLLKEKLELWSLRSQKKREYSESVPGLQEWLESLRGKLAAAQQSQQAGDTEDWLVRQLQESIQKVEARLQYKLGGQPVSPLGSQLPG